MPGPNMPRDEQGNIIRETKQTTENVSAPTTFDPPVVSPETVTPPIVPVEPIPEVVPKSQEVQKYTTATVLAFNGQTIRVYTLERHGEKFQDCAKSMSSQNPGSTIVLT